MSGFNYARTEMLARREGITFAEACRRLGRHGARLRRARRRQCACVEIQPTTLAAPQRIMWWNRD